MGKIRGVIKDIEEQVVNSKGFMYQMDSPDKYKLQLNITENEQVKRLRQELDEAIEAIFTNEEQDVPKLKINLDDERLYENPEICI